MGIGKNICVCKEYLRLEAKCNLISTRNNNTVCPCHTIEEVPSEATETTRTTVGLRRASVFLLMMLGSCTRRRRYTGSGISMAEVTQSKASTSTLLNLRTLGRTDQMTLKHWMLCFQIKKEQIRQIGGRHWSCKVH